MEIERGVPYDCSTYDDDQEVFVLPCSADGVEWWQLMRQTAWGVLIWLLVIALTPVAAKVWALWGLDQRDGAPPKWLLRHVGTEFDRAPDERLEVALSGMQFMGSTLLIIGWIRKAYVNPVPFGVSGLCFACLTTMPQVALIQFAFYFVFACTYLPTRGVLEMGLRARCFSYIGVVRPTRLTSTRPPPPPLLLLLLLSLSLSLSVPLTSGSTAASAVSFGVGTRGPCPLG